MNEYCSYLWQTYNTLCYLDCKMYFDSFILKKNMKYIKYTKYINFIICYNLT